MLKLLILAPITGLVVWVGSGVLHLGPGDDPAPQSADRSFGMSIADMNILNGEYKGAPIVLPVELPESYGWAGIGEEQGDGQEVWARSSQFTSVAGGPIVELCAKAAAQKRGCEQDDDPYVTRTLGDLTVFIRLTPITGQVGPAVRAFWEGVELTGDYEKVRWLDK